MLLSFSFIGELLIVKAIRDIRKDEEVLHCYGALTITNKFQYILFSKFIFHFCHWQDPTLEECQNQRGSKC